MDMDVRPSRVPQKGLPAPAALALVAVAVASVAGFAILSRTPVAPAPVASPAGAVSGPSGTPAPSTTPSPAAVVTPVRRPSCVAPRIAALTRPIVRHPRPLVPTGFEVLTPWAGAEGSLVADVKDGFWAAGNGRLVRLDARGMMTASWTLADDANFGAPSVIAAREGGVWLWGGPTIAWFDGEQFRDVVAAPTLGPDPRWVVDVAEAPDGSLWAAVNGENATISPGTVVHWDGATWTDACGPGPSVGLAQLAVDDAGGVWVAPASDSREIFFFDGATWSIPPSDPSWTEDRGVVNVWPVSLVAADDGSLWSADGGLGHFDGMTWTSARTDAVDLSGTVSLAAAPDNTIWLATGAKGVPGDTWGPHIGIAVAHSDGRTWVVYDDTDGLPPPEPSNYATITAVAASSTSVIAATRDGFYRLTGDHWVRAGPRPTAAPGWPEGLLAVSAREAWIAASDGLSRVLDGRWTTVRVAGWKPPLRAFDVARAPDGTLAVATDQGSAVRRAGRWTVLAEAEAHAVTIADDGTIWVAEHAYDSTTTTVVSFRLGGRGWVRTALPSVESAPGWPMQLVLASDGSPWLLSAGWVPSLVRFDGTSWVTVPADTAGVPGQIRGVALTPNGDPWVLAGGYTTDWAIARFDGAAWTLHRASDGLPQPGQSMADGGIAVAPDGSLWVATLEGLAHFDGHRWSKRFAGHPFYRLSFAPDGTLWAVGPSGVQRLPADLLAEPDPRAR